MINATTRYEFVIYFFLGWSEGDKRMGRLAVSKRHEKRVGIEAGHVLRIRRTANKETMWMLMRNKPTRYHSDNDTTHNLKTGLLFTQTQSAHTFIEYSREATPLRALMHLCVVRDSFGRWGNCSGAHLHLWLNVDDAYDCFPI